MRLTLQWIAAAIQGRIKQGNPDKEYIGISIDSRSLQSGEIFWALKGERFDGHDFIIEAVNKGAIGVVKQIGKDVSEIREDVIIIEVDDTLRALGDFAGRYRRLYDIPVVAVTGSNGKTTTKEMIAAILSLKKQVIKNKGNLNNLIGLPLSLLKLSSHHDIGVFELGMNRKGEIARLTEISDPSVGVITNIGPVHLEHLKSLDAVAESKGELFLKMSSEATAIINKDDLRVNKLSQRFSGRKITFGINHPAEVSARNIRLIKSEGINFELQIKDKIFPVYLPMIGEHNVMNALAAAAVVNALGEDPEIIPKGLKNFTNLSLRQEVVKIGDDIKLINDAYNANPISMEFALKTFSQIKGSSRGIAVLGDMLELGAESITLHHRLGKQIAKFGIDYLLLLGEYASVVKEGAIAGDFRPDHIFIGKEHAELSDLLKSILKKGDWVLVKGSRKRRMEKVVDSLLNKFKE